MANITTNTIRVANVVSNTSVSIIQITEDKLINILSSHIVRLKKSREWMAAGSFAVSLLVVLLTAEFKPKWGIAAEGWRMLFYVVFAISVIFTIYSIYNSIRNKIDVNSIVKDIKGS